jgi:hypothetical protein
MNNLTHGDMIFKKRKYVFTVEATASAEFEMAVIKNWFEDYRTYIDYNFEGKAVHKFEMTESKFYELLSVLEDLAIEDFDIVQECTDCYGEGECEVGPACSMPANMCCGGCYTTEVCYTCEGAGVVEPERYY